MKTNRNQERQDFEQALGESFGECVSPPVPFEDASPHECCEVIWAAIGVDVTPTQLSELSEAEIASLAMQFGKYFEVESPAPKQIKAAIERTLARWPIGSLGEGD